MTQVVPERKYSEEHDVHRISAAVAPAHLLQPEGHSAAGVSLCGVRQPAGSWATPRAAA